MFLLYFWMLLYWTVDWLFVSFSPTYISLSSLLFFYFFFSSAPSHYSSNHVFAFVWQTAKRLSVSHALLTEAVSLGPNTLTYISELMTYIHNSGLPSLTIATSFSPPLRHHFPSPSLILLHSHTLLLVFSHPLFFIWGCLILYFDFPELLFKMHF